MEEFTTTITPHGVILFVSQDVPPRYFFQVEKVHPDHRDKILPKGEITSLASAKSWFEKEAADNQLFSEEENPSCSFFASTDCENAEVFVIICAPSKVEQLQGPNSCWQTKKHVDGKIEGYKPLDRVILAMYEEKIAQVA